MKKSSLTREVNKSKENAIGTPQVAVIVVKVCCQVSIVGHRHSCCFSWTLQSRWLSLMYVSTVHNYLFFSSVYMNLCNEHLVSTLYNSSKFHRSVLNLIHFCVRMYSACVSKVIWFMFVVGLADRRQPVFQDVASLCVFYLHPLEIAFVSSFLYQAWKKWDFWMEMSRLWTYCAEMKLMLVRMEEALKSSMLRNAFTRASQHMKNVTLRCK